MSANNFMRIQRSRRQKGKWEVWVKDCETGAGHPEDVFDTKAEAVEWAAVNDYTEYGISIEPNDSPTIINQQ